MEVESMRKRRLEMLLAKPVLAAACFGQGAIHTVDGGGGAGVDFLEISDAVEAASNGDLILVETGDYDAFSVDGKSLVIEGVGPGISCRGARFENLLASQRVVVRNIALTPLSAPVVLSDNAGVVWIEDCLSAPLDISDCAAVALLSTSVEGALALGLPAVAATDSTLYLDNSSIAAGDLFDTGCLSSCCGQTCGIGANGIPGMTLHDSVGYLFSSQVFGGDGQGVQDGFLCEFCCTGGDGGPGVVLTGSSELSRNFTFLFGGQGGGGFGCDDGLDAPAIEASTGSTVEDLSGLRRWLEADSPSSGGSVVDLNVFGQSGDTHFVYASFAPAITSLVDTIASVGWVQPPLTYLGTTSGSAASLPVSLPALPLGPLEHLEVFLQGLAVTPLGDVRLGAPTAMTIVP